MVSVFCWICFSLLFSVKGIWEILDTFVEECYRSLSRAPWPNINGQKAHQSTFGKIVKLKHSLIELVPPVGVYACQPLKIRYVTIVHKKCRKMTKELRHIFCWLVSLHYPKCFLLPLFVLVNPNGSRLFIVVRCVMCMKLQDITSSVNMICTWVALGRFSSAIVMKTTSPMIPHCLTTQPMFHSLLYV